MKDFIENIFALENYLEEAGIHDVLQKEKGETARDAAACCYQLATLAEGVPLGFWSKLIMGRSLLFAYILCYVKRTPCRIKQGRPAVHPLRGPELRALRQLRRTYSAAADLFVSEHGGPLTARAVHHIVLRTGEIAGLSFPIHPHMCVKTMSATPAPPIRRRCWQP